MKLCLIIKEKEYHMNKTFCRSCLNEDLKSVIDLGLSPLANNLLSSNNDVDELYPLDVMYCNICHNCQLSYVVPPNKMFDNYLYKSSTTKLFRDHFVKASEKYITKFNLNEKSIVLDIGSNDGIGLRPFKENNINVIGVEPAKNIADLANENNIYTINSYFNNEILKLVTDKIDIITASNVFAHSDELEQITNIVFKLLKPDGVFIIEVQYLLDTIKDLTFDNIYHEHVNYWCVTSLNNFFNRIGYTIVDVEHIDTHGGSIRVYIKKEKDSICENVKNFLKNEKEFGLTEYNTYISFSERINIIKNNVKNNIKKLKEKNFKLVGYGSPAKATTALNFYNITNEEIDYIIEDNDLKHNKIIPNVRIPIYSKEKLNDGLPDIIIVMAWNFFENIKNNNQDLINKGVKIINIKDLENSF
jgi:SAM-dependent methyltransferase